MACYNPIHLKNKPSVKSAKTHYNVPCGKCNGCKKAKKLEWCVRMEQELKHAYSSYFITLTYRPEDIPLLVDTETGELFETLDKSDLQKFIQRLQKRNLYHYAREHGITQKEATRVMPTFKHFSCGEYGTQTQRPHYHMVVFNLNPFLANTLNRETAKETKDDIWKKGIVECVPTQHGKISYVTKYLLDEEDVPKYADEPFKMMSPNIGIQYLTKENIQYHRENFTNRIKMDSGKFVAMPRFYYNKIFNPSQKEIVSLINERKKWEAQDDLRAKYKNLTDNQYEQYLIHMQHEDVRRIKKSILNNTKD